MSGQMQLIAAVTVFIAVYGLIVFNKGHRTVVAFAGAILLILLGILSQREAFAAIDFNTLGLLIGMMIIVGILQQSGLFEYLAVWSGRLGGGEPFRILLILSVITALLSAMLDNITTVILIVPVTFSIVEVLGVSPYPFLFAEIIASNIGGTATLIGDPPNIMIGSAARLGFLDFIKNLGPVVALIFLVTSALFWLLWGRRFRVSEEKKKELLDLDLQGQIRDPVLLRRGLMVLGLTFLGFLLHQFINVESATIALGGAVLMLLLTDTTPEEAFWFVDWSTIFFFAGLFVAVGALEKVGVIHALATWSLHVTGGSLVATGLLVLWLAALASAVVDNIPFVAAMIPLIKDLGAMTGMPLVPLWWALALGACLGGNGSLIGASANVIVSGIARQKGYPFTFMGFTRVAFPLMILSILICHAYLYFFFLR
ncbi:MAG TPA: ArsB/NhaD family transporter [Syntrophomonadaceae bacterium]|nr:ArsB/NhaD family transporter [Syntrophomonadaceae bacterium]